ncbi:hypothetical protein EPD65_01805 [Nocardioides jejuensis]|uniref:Uncharacterized protein n=1 Tax=Nocardioides jejuensis TaxID=2502782 RepID=A0A4R1CKQ8_9ACTN|nr:hypothetical protein EPD65_01805 [Nocardioides jejuensis]
MRSPSPDQERDDLRSARPRAPAAERRRAAAPRRRTARGGGRSPAGGTPRHARPGGRCRCLLAGGA